jgi:O-antigen/teichoic acid export membrane protein
VTVETVGLGTFRAAVVRGLAWKAGTQLVAQLTRVVVAVAVARLVTPQQYGIAGMVLVFSSLLLVFSDLALGAALIQRPRISDEDKSTVFWTSAAAGLAFTLVGVASAGEVARFYGQPEVKPLFMALSLGFAITAVATTQSALLNREMDFKSLELRQMAGIVFGGATGVALAAKGAGAWAIIGQQLAVAGGSTICLWWFSDWKPSFSFSMRSLRDLGGFSGNVFGTRLLFYFQRNVDNMLVGRFIGATALGAYALAYSVMLVPFNQIAGPVQEVLYPAFSRMQNETGRMAGVWVSVNRIVGAISLPSLVGLMVVGPDFVHVVLGDKWAHAAPVIQILCWVGLLQSLQRLNSSVLQARDRTRDLLVYSIIALVGSVIAFVVGLPWGIVGVATAYAISSTVIEPYYTWLTARALDTSVFEFLRGLRGVAEATAAMAAVLVPARLVLVHAGVTPTLRFVLLVALGAAVYAPLAWWRVPELADFAAQLRRRRSRAAAPGAA